MKTITDAKARDAVGYNQRKSRSLGWKDSYTDIALLVGVEQPAMAGAGAGASGFGMPPMCVEPGGPSGEAFAQAVAKWQKAQIPSMTVDGKIGPGTWRRMQNAFNQCVMPGPLPAWLNTAPAASPRRSSRVRSDASIQAGGLSAPWIDVALSEMRTHWRSNGSVVKESALSVDEDYFDASPYFGGKNQAKGARLKDNAHWCAAFVNFCLHTAGYSHCGAAGAKCFTWGSWWEFEVLPSPRRGCVIVVGSKEIGEDTSTGHHVGFLDTWNDLPDNPNGDVRYSSKRGLYLLGGNQSNTVQSNLEKRTMLAVRKGGVKSPYLWPKVGSNTCNCDLPTAQGHFCKAQWQ